MQNFSIDLISYDYNFYSERRIIIFENKKDYKDSGISAFLDRTLQA